MERFKDLRPLLVLDSLSIPSPDIVEHCLHVWANPTWYSAGDNVVRTQARDPTKL